MRAVIAGIVAVLLQLWGVDAPVHAFTSLTNCPGLWTTATKPGSPTDGECGYNSDTGIFEYYTATTSQWLSMTDGTINVRTFGARGDNATDNTTFINAAFTYARTLTAVASSLRNVSPIRIYFPPGVYWIKDMIDAHGLDDLLTWPNGPQITVDGYGAVIWATQDFGAASGSPLTISANQGALGTTLTFSSVPGWVVPGMQITNMTRLDIPQGTTVQSVDRVLNTITLSAATTGTVATAGDSIAISNLIPHPMYDMMGSWGLRTRGLTLNATSCGLQPSIGIQFGRIRLQNTGGLATSGGGQRFPDVNVEGCFWTSGVYNLAGENDLFDNAGVKMYNTTRTPSGVMGRLSGPYGYIADGANAWNFANISATNAPGVAALALGGATPASWTAGSPNTVTFTTASAHGLAVGTVFSISGVQDATNGYNGIYTATAVTSTTITANAQSYATVDPTYSSGGTLSTYPPFNLTQSFINNHWLGGEIISVVGGTANPIWISGNAESVRFTDSYVNSNSGATNSTCVYASSPNVVSTSLKDFWIFDFTCEGPQKSVFTFNGSNSAELVHSLRYKQPIDHSQTSTFAIDNSHAAISALSSGVISGGTLVNNTYNWLTAPVPYTTVTGSGAGATGAIFSVTGCPGACTITTIGTSAPVYSGGHDYAVNDTVSLPASLFGDTTPGATVTFTVTGVGISTVQIQNADISIDRWDGAYSANVFDDPTKYGLYGTYYSGTAGRYNGPLTGPGGTQGTVCEAATCVTYFPQGTVAAAGSSRTNATAITAMNTTVTATATTQGVVMPPAQAGEVFTLMPGGGGAVTFHVYANGSDAINGTAGSTGITFTNSGTTPTIFYCFTSGAWVTK